MVNTYSLEGSELEIDIFEVLRYMGTNKKEENDEIIALAKKGMEELKGKIKPAACYEKYPVLINGDEIDLGFIKLKSNALAKNLKNCREALIFAASIGIETDRLIGKYSLLSPSYANCLAAVGTAAIEKWCDEAVRYLEEKEGQLCPRFSPGYGDLSLDVQKDILKALDTERKIGVHLTDSALMLPTKSVSAIVGIKSGSKI